ncbi:nuclear transport factor 2 family protein [Actinoplanes couchii]|uniref:PhzA/B-like protein n=1 Tax=Actinoplanes couchii TaxID=403638 RepID=A0ABQ3XEF7_9ACTN|nr:nuclear transport factor 2 family protein [Actinoplanes couchii]MDR6319745.1 ketosteroid isomerase-like protein [Actinoplanes couchii]GID56879.1 putative PhzA/B-like protein [Actinoplanes couchii]
MNPTPAQHALSEHLRLVSSGQIDEWISLYATDGRIEFPFAPAGVPTEVQGREALIAHMRGFPQTFDLKFVDVKFIETTDQRTAVAEYRSEGNAVSTGKPYHQTVISVIHLDEAGLVERFVDYWNPLVAIEAMTPDEAASGANDVAWPTSH